jgi:hypothetical protein
MEYAVYYVIFSYIATYLISKYIMLNEGYCDNDKFWHLVNFIFSPITFPIWIIVSAARFWVIL